MQHIVTLIGHPPLHWKSLQRVYDLYKFAIESHCLMRLADNDSNGAISCKVYFRLNKSDLENLGYGPPNLIALHGSCVLNPSEVKQILGKLRECDGVIVTCSSDIEIIKSFKLEPEPIIILLPLGSELQSNHENPSLLLRAALGIPSDKYIVACVGRLIPHKNAQVFLRFIAWLRKTENVVGLLVGDYWDDYPIGITGSKFRNYLENLLEEEGLKQQDFLRFNGNLDNEDLSLLLSGSDLLFHPSLTLDENFGFVPVEAISCGTPVVSTDYGGMKDNILDKLTGIRVRTWVSETGPRADFLKMFKFSKKILTDKSTLKTMSGQCLIEKSRFISDRSGQPLITGIMAAILAHSIGKTRKCVVCAPSSTHLKTRWQFEESLAQWPQVSPSVTHYVSSPDVPNVNQFLAVRKFGLQSIIGNTLTVTDPTVGFIGEITREESRILSSIGLDWLQINTFKERDLNTLNSLLAAGVLVGTAG